MSFLLLAVSGWVHRRQLLVMEYLETENRLLKSKLKGKRLRFTDAERALLARKAKALGRQALFRLDTLVSPDTLLRWHGRLIAQKWDYSHRRGCARPERARVISDLICRIAQENPTWGYTRIQGSIAKVGHTVGRGTIANILLRNGIERAPEWGRRTRWSTFLKAHWAVLAASDFLSVEVWTGKGLVTHYLLFVINLADRAVQVLGLTTNPNEAWMLQMTRNAFDCEQGILCDMRYLIIDRDTKYSDGFRQLISSQGIEVVRLPPRSPNLNAYAERFDRSVKEECLNRMIFIGQSSLRRAISAYVVHYHHERNHQGLSNRLIRPSGAESDSRGTVRLRRRLGGMLNYYERVAA